MKKLQKELPHVSFLGISRATTPPDNFLTAIFLPCKKIVRTQDKKNKLVCFESVIFAFELPANSAVVCIAALCFEHAQHFHISHFMYRLRYYIIIDHC